MNVTTVPPDPRLGYLPALDGLRALAVLLVVAYHLDLPWARGGFLGVDLFFVISGFLITTLLLREHRATDRIAIGSFWVRRFKRLVPPVVVVVIATVVATRLWGVPEQWRSVRLDAVSSIGYVANWRFVVAEQSYFESTLGPSPLRHMWSLALEEQWYFVWPVVVAALMWFAAASARRRWLPTIAALAGAIGSAALMAVLYDPTDPSRVYYGTDTRAQHLLIGAALAFAADRIPTILGSPFLRNRVLMHGFLGLFVVVAVFVDDEAAWLYRGGLLAVSVVAAVVVAAVAGPWTDGPLAWLGSRPLMWLGRRSYAVYLWHWPVIVFVGPPTGVDLAPLPLAALQVLISVALADLTFRFVESPVRRARPAQIRLVTGWGLGAVGSVVLAMIVLAAPADRGAPIAAVVRPSPSLAVGPPSAVASATVRLGPPAPLETAAPALDVSPTTADVTTAPWPAADDLVRLRGEDGTSQAAVAQVPGRVLLLGDSTAVVMSTQQPDSARWNTEVFARLGCSTTDGSTVDTGSSKPTRHAPECAGWRNDWTVSRDLVEPDVAVVMIGAWELLDHVIDGEFHRFPSPEWHAVVQRAVVAAIDVANGDDQNDVVVTTLPCMQQSTQSDFGAQARNDRARVDAFNQIVRDAAAASPHTSVVALDELLCPAGEPLVGADGRNIRYDGVHLTPEGIDLTWQWLLTELDALDRPRPS